MAQIAGSEVIWSYSTDNGSTWKAVVCQVSADFNRSRSVTKTETSCGVKKSFGPSDDIISYTGVFETTPGASEGSYTELQALYNANTEFDSKFATVGNEPFATGAGKLSQLNINVGGASQPVQFSATFEFTEDIDITP